MAKRIIIKPYITEKTEKLTTSLNRYTFIVDKKANKIEIKKAVEALYQVSVDSVNTAVMPGKARSRYTKAGVIRGMKPSYKKAIITLADGHDINFYGEV